MANLKTEVIGEQSTSNFPKNEHFLPPDTLLPTNCLSVCDHFAVLLLLKGLNLTLAFSDFSQISKMELLPEIVNGSFV